MNDWYYYDSEPGTLKYALQVQDEYGGIIRIGEGGWYWVDMGLGGAVNECKPEGS